MIDLLKEALSSPAGSFSFIFSIVMLGGLIIFYVTKVLTKIQTEHGQFGNRIDNIEVNFDRRMDNIEVNFDRRMDKIEVNFDRRMDKTEERFNRRMDKTDASIYQIKTDIADIKGVINVHKSDIAEMKEVINTRLETSISKKKSPEVLTEEGEKIVSDYNLDVMVDSNWERISAAISSLGTRNPYDLQEYCFTTGFRDTLNITDAKFFSESDIDKLKIVAYKTGYPLVIISKTIMGILIRERYFKENGIDDDDANI